jgi:hypothetical protein
VIRAPLRFFRAPQPRIGGHHFRDRVAGAKPLAQLPKRTIGDACHRRDDQVVGDDVGADAHEDEPKKIGDCGGGGADYNRSRNALSDARATFFLRLRRAVARFLEGALASERAIFSERRTTSRG